MRILYFTQKDSPHDRRFLDALAGTLHQVYALRQYDCQTETSIGVTEVAWPEEQPDWSNWRGWQAGKSQFLKIVNKIQPDLVHAGPVQGPALLAALAGVHPLVTMSWGSDLLVRAKRSPWMRLATQYTLEHTDIFLGDCQTVTDEAVSYGFPSDQIVLFPWGVDLDYFSPENGRQAGMDLRQSLGWADKFVIFCNRTWAPLYGVDVLAKAFVNAANKNERLRLILAGDGPQTQMIHRILAPVARRVKFFRWLDLDLLPGVYCAADLFVSPSHSDGASISLLEALACGRPALVSDIPSNQEWITPHKTGDVFRDGDAASLCDKLLALAAVPNLDQYGKQARLLALERANWQDNFQKLLNAYQMALG